MLGIEPFTNAFLAVCAERSSDRGIKAAELGAAIGNSRVCCCRVRAFAVSGKGWTAFFRGGGRRPGLGRGVTFAPVEKGVGWG